MKITREMVRRIKAAVRDLRGRRKAEVGQRCWPNQTDAEDGWNFLSWGPDNDLDSTYPVDDLIGEEVADVNGWVAFDLYLYTPEELDCNAYVLLAPDGTVKYASCDDLGHRKAIRKILAEAGITWDNRN